MTTIQTLRESLEKIIRWGSDYSYHEGYKSDCADALKLLDALEAEQALVMVLIPGESQPELLANLKWRATGIAKLET